MSGSGRLRARGSLGSLNTPTLVESSTGLFGNLLTGKLGSLGDDTSPATDQAQGNVMTKPGNGCDPHMMDDCGSAQYWGAQTQSRAIAPCPDGTFPLNNQGCKPPVLPALPGAAPPAAPAAAMFTMPPKNTLMWLGGAAAVWLLFLRGK